MKCKNCGYENNNNGRFCQGCGAELKSTPTVKENHYEALPTPKKKNKGFLITSIILSVLLVATIVAIILVLVLGGKSDKKDANDYKDYLICTGSGDDGNGGTFDGNVIFEIDENQKVKTITANMTFSSTNIAKKNAEVLRMQGIDCTIDGKMIVIEDMDSLIKLFGNKVDLIGESESYSKQLMEDDDLKCH